MCLCLPQGFLMLILVKQTWSRPSTSRGFKKLFSGKGLRKSKRQVRFLPSDCPKANRKQHEIHRQTRIRHVQLRTCSASPVNSSNTFHSKRSPHAPAKWPPTKLTSLVHPRHSCLKGQHISYCINTLMRRLCLP
jgi:hypothetical protein